jgi:hypothetical protein
VLRSAPPRDYLLHIPEEIERRLRRCRLSIRQAIHARLVKIAKVETKGHSARRARPATLGPALRFYASESYRVSYNVDRKRRRVVVLAFREEADE